jgi:hypothetical protein
MHRVQRVSNIRGQTSMDWRGPIWQIPLDKLSNLDGGGRPWIVSYLFHGGESGSIPLGSATSYIEKSGENRHGIEAVLAMRAVSPPEPAPTAGDSR